RASRRPRTVPTVDASPGTTGPVGSSRCLTPVRRDRGPPRLAAAETRAAPRLTGRFARGPRRWPGPALRPIPGRRLDRAGDTATPSIRGSPAPGGDWTAARRLRPAGRDDAGKPSGRGGPADAKAANPARDADLGGWWRPQEESVQGLSCATSVRSRDACDAKIRTSVLGMVWRWSGGRR